MALRNQVFIWIGLLLALILSLWIFRGILLPFVVGAALAYLLNPLVNQLQRWRFNRVWATVVVLLSVLTVVVSLFFMVVPLIGQQIIGLIQRLPGYVGDLQELAVTWSPEINAWLGPERTEQLQASLNDLARQALAFIATLPAELVNIGLTGVAVVGFTVLAPVVAFYLLLDWDALMGRGRSLVPPRWRESVQGFLNETDDVLGRYLRGQLMVMGILAVFYSVGLALVGLNLALPIGVFTGLATFVPFLGFGVGLVLALLAALLEFQSFTGVALVFGVYMLGQLVESYWLTPRLVGEAIGLHPISVIFALLAFGHLFGFVGVLIALPASAVLLVALRRLKRQYMASDLYLKAPVGHNEPPRLP